MNALTLDEVHSDSTRPQPSHLARGVSLGRLLLGSTHPSWQLSGQAQTDGLDVGWITLCVIGLTAVFADRGNLLVIGSTVAYAIALTWGGTTAPWGSAMVLVPFVLGLVGLVGFIAYEMVLATHPLVRDFAVYVSESNVSFFL